jgi:hypothetical protein
VVRRLTVLSLNRESRFVGLNFIGDSRLPKLYRSGRLSRKEVLVLIHLPPIPSSLDMARLGTSNTWELYVDDHVIFA